MVSNIYISGCENKYPKEILKGRKTVEGNVIACILKDPLLLDEIALETKDFLTSDGAYYFALAKQIRNKGYTSFDEITVLSSISEDGELGFNERGGWESIQTLIDIINNKNWDIYLDTLYRENLIINFYNSGFNLLSSIKENGKEIVPLNLFRKMDSESVLDWYESRLSNFSTGYSTRILEEEELDLDDEFFESCDAGLECGVPFDKAGEDINLEDINCLPFLSRQIGGLADATTSIIGGYSSSGKTTLFITILMALIYRGRKTLVISNEQKVKVFKASFTIWILSKYFRYYNLTKKKLLSGDLTEEDKKYRKLAQEYWRKNCKGKIKFIGIPDADMSLVKKKIRENVLRNGYDAVLYDTFKLDLGDKNDQAHITLLKDSRELDKIGKKYNIIMMASLQLAINTLGKLFLDASVLSMSKQIKEVLENLLLMRIVYSEELDPQNSKYYCRPFQLKKINDKWIEEEYIPDPSATWRMLFIDKCRMGESSSDSGTCLLLKFDGSHGIFRETAYCRPRHGYIT